MLLPVLPDVVAADCTATSVVVGVPPSGVEVAVDRTVAVALFEGMVVVVGCTATAERIDFGCTAAAAEVVVVVQPGATCVAVDLGAVRTVAAGTAGWVDVGCTATTAEVVVVVFVEEIAAAAVPDVDCTTTAAVAAVVLVVAIVAVVAVDRTVTAQLVPGEVEADADRTGSAVAAAGCTATVAVVLVVLAVLVSLLAMPVQALQLAVVVLVGSACSTLAKRCTAPTPRRVRHLSLLQ